MKPKIEYNTSYWVALTLQTRRYGHTYVHSGARESCDFAFSAFHHENIAFSYEGYGRSLLSGGHKYKVHARYIDTGKPVPSKVLKAL